MPGRSRSPGHDDIGDLISAAGLQLEAQHAYPGGVSTKTTSIVHQSAHSSASVNRQVLWLLRAPEGVVSRTHIVELKSKFVANDLDLPETRALHSCLPTQFENDADGAKAVWRAGFRKRLQELACKEAAGTLKATGRRHPAYKVSTHAYGLVDWQQQRQE